MELFIKDCVVSNSHYSRGTLNGLFPNWSHLKRKLQNFKIVKYVCTFSTSNCILDIFDSGLTARLQCATLVYVCGLSVCIALLQIVGTILTSSLFSRLQRIDKYQTPPETSNGLISHWDSEQSDRSF